MSRVPVAFLGFCLSVQVFSQNQTIHTTSGLNFIAVELKVGQNRLIDLFLDTPEGTLVFTFDNSSGWSAAQMYPFGWSHPDLRIPPWAGLIMLLPSGSSWGTTLSGEVVPLPVQNPPIGPFAETAAVYRGFNLISARLAKQVNSGLIYAFNPNSSTYNAYQYDDLLGGWNPDVPADSGAVWLMNPHGQVHPNGSFANDRTALYFNNYAPAFGVDAPLVGPNCETATDGSAQLTETKNAVNTLIGAPVPLSTNHPGYFEPSADLIRYVNAEHPHFVQYESIDFRAQSEHFTIANGAGATPPLPPSAMSLNPTTAIFRVQPLDVSFRPGDTLQLRAIFHHAIVLDPQVSLAVPFQWQKQIPAGEWTDVSGATNDTFLVQNAEASHAGAYRLRATHNCREIFSRVTRVELLAPSLSIQAVNSNANSITLTLPVPTKAKIQVSDNLEQWSDYAVIQVPQTNWTTQETIDARAKFYRAVEVP